MDERNRRGTSGWPYMLKGKINMNNKKILFVCEGKITKDNWSGTTLSLYNGLKRCGFDVEPIEIVLPNLFQRVVSKAERTISKISTKRVDFLRHPLIVALRKRSVSKLFAGKPYDAIFAVGSLSAACLPEKVEKPVFQYIDGTIAVMEKYYSSKPTATASLRYEHRFEVCGLQKSMGGGLIFAASDWVGESCIRDYKIPEDCVIVTRIGSNNEVAMTDNTLNTIIDKREESLLKGELNILFVGKDWDRKGGTDLLNLSKKLMKKVKKLRVCIVGCAPDIPNELRSAVKVYERLNYDVPEDKAIFDELYESAHFFVLPTHAECAGVVFCESSNRGLPSIAYSTGGVPSVIQDGVNGYLFEMKQANVLTEMSKRILETAEDTERYRKLCKTTYSFYEDNLCWEKIMNIICQNINTKCK